MTTVSRAIEAVEYVVDLPTLAAGFAMGLVAIYFKERDRRKVFVFPTASNRDGLQYRDLAGHCFEVAQEPVPCEAARKFDGWVREVVPQM